MWNDDYDYQRRTGITFKTKKGAEYLERVIFTCPECEQTETMRSEGNRFFCQKCGFETVWTPAGYLRPVNSGAQPTRSVTEWVSWQSDFCDKKIQGLIAAASELSIFSDHNVTLKVGYKAEPLKSLLSGTMSLYIDRFVVANERREARVFPIKDIGNGSSGYRRRRASCWG